jgi:hypothetical protein
MMEEITCDYFKKLIGWAEGDLNCTSFVCPECKAKQPEPITDYSWCESEVKTNVMIAR